MSDIEQMEISLDYAKELVRRKKAVEKLMSNREFKLIVTKGYMEEEAARLASASAEPSLESRQAMIFDQIKSISHLNQYLRMIVQMGNSAEQEIAEYEHTLAEMRAEEGEL